ncbi:MAG: hypothetical protein K9N47_22840 [Prosthecobacter sp.]|uniref:hypothetical protein n=1 Tax=Prosthecobacter sp. TaxID=1965333 RepID=UPI00261FB39A|nr:hypothetical protein [Prosthecobacter sp.]MCF7788980.1 hypothetical protein [Prosthecobacter sp.]
MRKLKLSFLAMLCGWIAWNIVCWVGMLTEVPFDEIRIQDAMKVLYLGAATGVVILAAWLVIFLPVDLLIPDHSKLRRPWPASIFGFLAGSSVMVIIWGSAFLRDGSTTNGSELFTWQAFFLLSSPGVTGMVAAYMRSRDREPMLN